jgi:serine/threonine protein phosphatase PrpC
MSQYKIEAATGQHLGSRDLQQDRTALLLAPKSPGYVLAVLADSLGGRLDATIAAEQVMYTSKQLFDNFEASRHDPEKLLRTIVHDAHLVIKINGFSAQTEPHSTIVALLLSPEGEAIWAHVGDSRLYRFEKDQCLGKTNDDAYIDKLTQDGKLTREAAKNHRHSHLLMNALGHSINEPFVTIGRQSNLKIGDAFLLCSDGLWHYFKDTELARAVHLKAPRQASELLIEKAQERAMGKGDNCTMAIVKLVKPEPEVKGYTVEKLRRAV